ncbi:MAG: response regulator [Bacteroidetes bacterium]|nr:response regulator [Bacteroidota bacterium]MCW5897190.1 response regulator [Bacteroidota bacterium]
MDRGKGLIAILDDDKKLRSALKMVLQYAGYVCCEAEDKASFLESIDSVQPDIVLTDIMSPGMDGIEFLERIKQNQKTGDIPIIIVTGRGTEYKKDRAFELGAHAWVWKPVDRDELLNVIDDALTTVANAPVFEKTQTEAKPPANSIMKETAEQRKIRMAKDWVPFNPQKDSTLQPRLIYHVELFCGSQTLMRSFYRYQDALSFQKYCGSLRVRFEVSQSHIL